MKRFSIKIHSGIHSPIPNHGIAYLTVVSASPAQCRPTTARAPKNLTINAIYSGP
jgi:hypothetical protein